MRKLNKKRLYLLIIVSSIIAGIPITILIYAIFYSPPKEYDLTLKVGQYDNAPKIYEDEEGNIIGIFPEILEYIAKKENWTIEWVEGTWTECLYKLNNSEIDIMVDVAYSEKRATYWDFNNVEVLNNWGILYKEKGSDIESIADLDNKEFAVMEGSIHTDGEYGIKNMVNSWNISADFIELEDYNEVFEYVDKGKADIGVVNRLFGLVNEGDYDVEQTSIMFNPRRLLFAFPKNEELNHELIPKIDEHLIELKENPDSIYYQILDKYIYREEGALILPEWVMPTIIVAVILIITFSSTSLILNRMVVKRTEQLKHRSEFSQLISDISTNFVGQTENLNNSIQEALRKIVEFTKTDSGYIFQFSDNYNKFSLTHLWRNDKIKLNKKELTDVSTSAIPTWIKKLKNFENIALASVDDFEHEREKQVLKSLGIKSVVDVPMPYNGKVIGFMGLSSIQEKREWSKDEINLLSIIGQVISSALALQKAYDELEEKVKERTKELSDANERLEELDHLKSMFIASTSHELRTPLTSIIGFTKTLLKGWVGDINEEQEKQLNIILNSANNLLDLINDILDVSKIEAGQLDIRKENFDLIDEIKIVFNSFKIIVEKKNLKLKLESPEHLVIFNDKTRVCQILVNLVGNAVKYTDEGEVSTIIQKEDDIIKILVKDTGPGIKEEDMDKLFIPFSRIAESGEYKEGTGLGLHLSRNLANLLGGEISAESEYGKGSTFTLSLKGEENISLKK